MLGADGHFYRRQLEGFADAILTARRCAAPNIDDGVASVRAMVGDRAVGADGRPVRLAEVVGRGLMRIGIFAKTFPATDALTPCSQPCAAPATTSRNTTWRARACASMPEQVDRRSVRGIAAASQRDGRGDRAVSGTYNMIHPDPAVRADGLAAAGTSSPRAAPEMGTRLVTLCTGTRDPSDQWAHHPDNASAGSLARPARRDGEGSRACREFDVDLGIEPELANVVSFAGRRGS